VFKESVFQNLLAQFFQLRFRIAYNQINHFVFTGKQFNCNFLWCFPAASRNHSVVIIVNIVQHFQFRR
jgi:hypothetical protein